MDPWTPEQAAELRGRSERLRRDVTDAVVERRQTVAHFASGMVPITDRLVDLEQRTRRSVHNLQPHLYFQPDQTTTPRLDERSRRRGLQMSMVVDEFSERSHPLLASTEHGLARVAPVFMQMLVCDESVVVVAGPPTASGDPTAWVLRDQSLADAALALWRLTAQVSRPARTPVPGSRLLSERVLEVARAMCLGETDVQTARRLGLSPRTVQRDAAEVMRYLGATSRPQAVALMLGRPQRGGVVSAYAAPAQAPAARARARSRV